MPSLLYETGVITRKILEDPKFREKFVSDKELLKEMYHTGKSPKELLKGRNLVNGYGFVKEYVDENLEELKRKIKVE